MKTLKKLFECIHGGSWQFVSIKQNYKGDKYVITAKKRFFQGFEQQNSLQKTISKRYADILSVEFFGKKTNELNAFRYWNKINKTTKNFSNLLNYAKTNQTFPVSADRFGTNLHRNVIGGAFSANCGLVLGIRVNKFARWSDGVVIIKRADKWRLKKNALKKSTRVSVEVV